MDILLEQSGIKQEATIAITGSKSESNRALILRALFPDLVINNLSNADDTQLLQSALNSKEEVIDIHHAGTAMRFLTAYFANQDGREVILTGSERMQQRPIKVLVEALRHLGADITYVKKEGLPPLRIKGKKLTKSSVSLPANVSSQYISALLLIAPQLKNGLQLLLEERVTSLPYIHMSLSLLNYVGVKTYFEDDCIQVDNLNAKFYMAKTITIESDWSSASYFYSLIALSPVGTQIHLASYKENSLQGDSALIEIYQEFGVETKFVENSMTLIKSKENSEYINMDLQNTPDLAQTVVVTCLGLGIGCDLSGLHTLKIKETDRLQALKNEIMKFGGHVEISEEALKLHPKAINWKAMHHDIAVETYNDHRMAMAFAPLILKTSLMIKDAYVVSKSYPEFWGDLTKIGLNISEI